MSVDANSALGEVYISQLRQFRKAGKQPHFRYAVNRQEKLIANDVNRIVDRITTGYQAITPTLDASQPLACERCGATDDLRIIGAVYLQGVRVDRARCHNH